MTLPSHHVIRTPRGNYQPRVLRGGAPENSGEEDATHWVWFFFDCAIRAREPEAVAAALRLHEEVSFVPVRLRGDRHDHSLIDAVRCTLDRAVRSRSLVFEPAEQMVVRVRPVRTQPVVGPTPVPPAREVAREAVHFLVKFVDETGEPIPDLKLAFSHAATTELATTDGSGSATLERSTGASVASVRVVSCKQLRDIVEPRWTEPRTWKLAEGPTVSRLVLQTDLPSFPLEDDVEHIVIVTPELGKLYVQLFDKSGRVLHAEHVYSISGPLTFSGVSDDQGIVVHEEVPPGDYELSLDLDGETYRTPLLVLDPGSTQPQIRQIGVRPRSVMAQMRGAYFDTNKSFLLPSGIEPVSRLLETTAENEPCELLVVGHTDTTADSTVNDPLSLSRAQSVVAYLTGDVDAWLAMYEVADPHRWGAREDALMAGAVLGGGDSSDAIRSYQAAHGKTPTGTADRELRRQLISDYVALSHGPLEDYLGHSVPLTPHGCGENFPLDETEGDLDPAAPDGAEDQGDRRVEVFIFDAEYGIQPPPPGSNSQPGSTEYPQWRENAVELYDYDAGAAPVCHLSYQLRSEVDDTPVANEPFVIQLSPVEEFAGTTDDSGRLSYEFVAPDDYLLQIQNAEMYVPALGPDEAERVLSVSPGG